MCPVTVSSPRSSIPAACDRPAPLRAALCLQPKHPAFFLRTIPHLVTLQRTFSPLHPACTGTNGQACTGPNGLAETEPNGQVETETEDDPPYIRTRTQALHIHPTSPPVHRPLARQQALQQLPARPATRVLSLRVQVMQARSEPVPCLLVDAFRPPLPPEPLCVAQVREMQR